ncbi:MULTISPECIES: ABC transporter substrate-binding protein [unclassified Corynebacterium]|uniref:ABC transporter substrate-binding protein n=1 Tax=unclassified Corynebacterium TaxID=2624378 RepID=UPI0034CD458A
MFKPKFVSALAALTGGALLLTGCGSVESANENTESENNAASSAEEWQAPEGLSGELDYYSANPQGLTDALVEAFEEKTDVKVNVFADTTGKITAKLKAEEANPQADVVYLASWSAAAKQDESGALEEYAPEGIDKANPKWNSENDTFHGRDGSALALVVNNNVVDEAPADWEDLTDEKYKDQVIMPDPRESGTAADLITAMVNEKGKDATWELFEKLFDNGMIIQGANGEALDQVTGGSRGIVMGGVDYSAYSAQDKGEALDVIIPSSGTTVTPRPVMILNSTDNKEAAEAFVDFMFSEEAQEISASKNMIPAHQDVEPKNGPALDDIKQLDDDWSSIADSSGDIKDEFVERFL